MLLHRVGLTSESDHLAIELLDVTSKSFPLTITPLAVDDNSDAIHDPFRKSNVCFNVRLNVLHAEILALVHKVFYYAWVCTGSP